MTVPIFYNSASPGASSLTLTGGTATSDTYTPGPGAGQGNDTLVFPGGTQSVTFTGLSPVMDTVSGPLTVTGTSGNDAISYGPGSVDAAHDGKVSVNSLESIEFTNKTSLTLNTGTGKDAVSVNNPNAPTG